MKWTPTWQLDQGQGSMFLWLLAGQSIKTQEMLSILLSTKHCCLLRILGNGTPT